MSSAETSLSKRFDEIEERINKLHATLTKLDEKLKVPDFESELEKRTYDACLKAGLKSFRMFRTDNDYYSKNLKERRAYLNAPSIHNLCKSIIVENTKCTRDDCSDPNNSKFYLVIIQYTTRLMSHKLFKFVRSLTPNASKGNYHFNLAKESDSFKLTGSQHNGVCPIGNLVNIPIILSSRITELSNDFIWLGGGDPTIKLGFSVKEFIEKFNPFIADVTFEGYNLKDLED